LLGTSHGGGAPPSDHPVTDQPDPAKSGWKTLTGIAGIISYLHAYELASLHGEYGITARLLPLT
jgi:hypothetical protein